MWFPNKKANPHRLAFFLFPLRNAQGASWLTTRFKSREPTATFSNTPVQSPERVTASPDLEIPTFNLTLV